MKPQIKLIRTAMLEAVAAIDRAKECESFFKPFNDNASRELIQEKQDAAAESIANVAQLISNAAKVTETITETE